MTATHPIWLRARIAEYLREVVVLDSEVFLASCFAPLLLSPCKLHIKACSHEQMQVTIKESNCSGTPSHIPLGLVPRAGTSSAEGSPHDLSHIHSV